LPELQKQVENFRVRPKEKAEPEGSALKIIAG
jgi:hypothetical protein